MASISFTEFLSSLAYEVQDTSVYSARTAFSSFFTTQIIALFFVGCFLGVAVLLIIDCRPRQTNNPKKDALHQRLQERLIQRVQADGSKSSASSITGRCCRARTCYLWRVQFYSRAIALADSVLDRIDAALVRFGLLPADTAAGDGARRDSSDSETRPCPHKHGDGGTGGPCEECLKTSSSFLSRLSRAPAYRLSPAGTSDGLPDVVLRYLSQRTLTSRMDCALRQPALVARLQEANARASAVRDAAALFSVGLADWTWDLEGPEGQEGQDTAQLSNGTEAGPGRGIANNNVSVSIDQADQPEPDSRPVIAFVFYVQLCSPFVALDMPGSGLGHGPGVSGQGPARGPLPLQPRPVEGPTPYKTLGHDSVEGRCAASSVISPVFPVRAGQNPLQVAWEVMAAEERRRCGAEPSRPFTIEHQDLAVRHGSIAAAAKPGHDPLAGYSAPMRHCPYIVPFGLGGISGQGAGAGPGMAASASDSRTSHTSHTTGSSTVVLSDLSSVDQDKGPLALSSYAFLVAELDGAHDRAVFVTRAGVAGLAQELMGQGLPGDGQGQDGLDGSADEGAHLDQHPGQDKDRAVKAALGNLLTGTVDDSASSALTTIAGLCGPMPLLHVALECMPLAGQGAGKGGSTTDGQGTPADSPTPPMSRDPSAVAVELVGALDRCFNAAACGKPELEVEALSRALDCAYAAGRIGRLPWQARKERGASRRVKVAGGRLTLPPGPGEDGTDTEAGHTADDEDEEEDSTSRGLEVATHPATLHLLRAAALARAGHWSQVITDVHRALAWGAGVFHPGMHSEAWGMEQDGLGQGQEEGREAFPDGPLPDNGHELATAWRFELPPRLKREALVLLGWAWQLLANPQAALVCFETAVRLGVSELLFEPPGQAGSGDGDASPNEVRPPMAGPLASGGQVTEEALTAPVSDDALSRLLDALVDDLPPLAPGPQELAVLSGPRVVGTGRAAERARKQVQAASEAVAIHRLSAVACAALHDPTSHAALRASVGAMRARLAGGPSLSVLAHVGPDPALGTGKAGQGGKDERAARVHRPTLVGAGSSAQLTWMPPRSSQPVNRGMAGARAGQAPKAHLGAVYWHTATFVPAPESQGSGQSRGRGRIFAFGGVGEHGPCSELAVCDVATRAWVPLTALPVSPPGPLYMHSAALVTVPTRGAHLLQAGQAGTAPAPTTTASPSRVILFLGGSGCDAAVSHDRHTLKQPWLFNTGTLAWGTVTTKPDAKHGHPSRRSAAAAAVVPAGRPSSSSSPRPGHDRVYVYGGLSLDCLSSLCGPWPPEAVHGDLWSLGWEGAQEAGDAGTEDAPLQLVWRRESAPSSQQGGEGELVHLPPPARYGATLTCYDPSQCGAIGAALTGTPSQGQGQAGKGGDASYAAARPSASALLATPGPKLVLLGGRDAPLGTSDGPPTGVEDLARAAVEAGDWNRNPLEPDFPPSTQQQQGQQKGQGTAQQGSGAAARPRLAGLQAGSVPSLCDVCVWDVDTATWLHPLVLGSPPSGAVWHSTVQVKHWLFVLGGQAGNWAWRGGTGPGGADGDRRASDGPAAPDGPSPAHGCLGPGYGSMVTAAVGSTDLALAAHTCLPSTAPGLLPLPSAFPRLGLHILDMHALHWTEPVIPLPMGLGPAGQGSNEAHVLPPFRYGLTAVATMGSPGPSSGQAGGKTAGMAASSSLAATRDRIIVFGGACPGLCVREDEPQAWAAAVVSHALAHGSLALEKGKNGARPTLVLQGTARHPVSGLSMSPDDDPSSVGPSSSLFLTVPGLVQELDVTDMSRAEGAASRADVSRAQAQAVEQHGAATGATTITVTCAAMPLPRGSHGDGLHGQGMGGHAGHSAPQALLRDALASATAATATGNAASVPSRPADLRDLLFGGAGAAAAGAEAGVGAARQRHGVSRATAQQATSATSASAGPAQPAAPSDLSWAEEWDRQQAAERAAAQAREAEARDRARAKAARKQEREQAKAREAKEKAEREREAARARGAGSKGGAAAAATVPLASPSASSGPSAASTAEPTPSDVLAQATGTSVEVPPAPQVPDMTAVPPALPATGSGNWATAGRSRGNTTGSTGWAGAGALGGPSTGPQAAWPSGAAPGRTARSGSMDGVSTRSSEGWQAGDQTPVLGMGGHAEPSRSVTASPAGSGAGPVANGPVAIDESSWPKLGTSGAARTVSAPTKAGPAAAAAAAAAVAATAIAVGKTGQPKHTLAGKLGPTATAGQDKKGKRGQAAAASAAIGAADQAEAGDSTVYPGSAGEALLHGAAGLPLGGDAGAGLGSDGLDGSDSNGVDEIDRLLRQALQLAPFEFEGQGGRDVWGSLPSPGGVGLGNTGTGSASLTQADDLAWGLGLPVGSAGDARQGGPLLGGSAGQGLFGPPSKPSIPLPLPSLPGLGHQGPALAGTSELFSEHMLTGPEGRPGAAGAGLSSELNRAFGWTGGSGAFGAPGLGMGLASPQSQALAAGLGFTGSLDSSAPEFVPSSQAIGTGGQGMPVSQLDLLQAMAGLGLPGLGGQGGGRAQGGLGSVDPLSANPLQLELAGLSDLLGGAASGLGLGSAGLGGIDMSLGAWASQGQGAGAGQTSGRQALPGQGGRGGPGTNYASALQTGGGPSAGHGAASAGGSASSGKRPGQLSHGRARLSGAPPAPVDVGGLPGGLGLSLESLLSGVGLRQRTGWGSS